MWPISHSSPTPSPEQWFSKHSSSSKGILCKFVRNANSQACLTICWTRNPRIWSSICVLKSLLSEKDTCFENHWSRVIVLGTQFIYLFIHWKSKRVPEKTSISVLLTMPKPLTVWITINSGKFWKRWDYQITWPASWEICMQVRKQ